MIKTKTFVFNSLQVNTYVLSDETLNAVIIDPAFENKLEFSVLIEYLESNNLIPSSILVTHAHVDHILGINSLIEKYNLPFLMHSDDLFLLSTAAEFGNLLGFNVGSISKPTRLIIEGEKILFGNSMLEIRHVPGHSPGSIVFYSSKDNLLIAGDVLFNGSIGRTDLPGGDYQTLIHGIHQKILTLPAETVVYPGHGPTTTIMDEQNSNPFLI